MSWRMYNVTAKNWAKVVQEGEWSMYNIDAEWNNTKIFNKSVISENPRRAILYAIIAAWIYEIIRYLVVIILF